MILLAAVKPVQYVHMCTRYDDHLFCSPGGSPPVLLPASVRTEVDAVEHSTPWWCAEKPPSDLSQNNSTAPQSVVQLVSELPSVKEHNRRQDNVW